MATPEERQAFVLDSLLKLNDVSILTHTKLAENRVTNEYDNCRNVWIPLPSSFHTTNFLDGSRDLCSFGTRVE